MKIRKEKIRTFTHEFKEVSHVVIPIMCILIWAFRSLVIVNFNLSKVYIFPFYGVGEKILKYQWNLYSPETNFFALPIIALIFTLISLIIPLSMATYIFFFIDIIAAIFSILEFNKILKLYKVKNKFFRGGLLILISNGFIITDAFSKNQLIFIVAFILFTILRRELQFRDKIILKDKKYLFLNYNLFLLGVAIYPVLIMKENLLKTCLAIISFSLQNFLFFIFPKLLIDFFFSLLNQINSSWFLFYLIDMNLCRSLNFPSYITIIFLIFLSIITLLLIILKTFKLEEKFGLSSLSYIYFCPIPNLGTLIIYLPFILLIFLPFFKIENKKTLFFKKNSISLINIFLLVIIYFHVRPSIIFSYLPFFLDSFFALYIYLFYLLIILILGYSVLLIFIDKIVLKRKSNNFFKYSYFLFSFIIIYFLFIIQAYLVPNGFNLSLLIFLGFAIIISCIFYLLSNINNLNKNISFTFQIINENGVKLIIMILMCCVFFIPSVKFSEIIVDWNQISLATMFKAIIFFYGSAFLIGSCLISLLFPTDSFFKNFKIEPIFLKITIYPFLSFSFLGILTFFLDRLNVLAEILYLILFLSIIILFSSDFVTQKIRGKKIRPFRFYKIKLSRNSIIMIIFSLGILLITLGIQLKSRYLNPGDAWRAIQNAIYIGNPNEDPYQIAFSSRRYYPTYWGHIIFGLSKLCGIPMINTCSFFTFFIIYFTMTIYLFMKGVLNDFKESYVLIATCLVITFSNLFFIFHAYIFPLKLSDLELALSNISTDFIFESIIHFRYKSYALLLFLISLTFYISLVKTSNISKTSFFLKTENFRALILLSIFLFQSYMIYYFPLIMATKENLKILLMLWALFSIIFFIFDLSTSFYYSSFPVSEFSFFQGKYKFMRPDQLKESLIIYLLIIIFFGFITVILFSLKIFEKKNEWMQKIKFPKLKFNFNNRLGHFIFLGLFSFSLIGLQIMFNIYPEIVLLFSTQENSILKYNQTFLFYYLNLIFCYMGLIGILGILSIYSVSNKNKRLSKILVSWLILIFFISSFFIFSKWMESPNLIFSSKLFYREFYWFRRTWYYSIIPLSILASIGLVEFINFLNSKIEIRSMNIKLKSIPKLLSISFFIFLIISNIFILSLFWANREKYYRSMGTSYYINDEEAHLIGWMSQNLPDDAKIMNDRVKLTETIESIKFYEVYPTWSQTKYFDSKPINISSTPRSSDFAIIEGMISSYGNMYEKDGRYSRFISSTSNFSWSPQPADFILTKGTKEKDGTLDKIDLNYTELKTGGGLNCTIKIKLDYSVDKNDTRLDYAYRKNSNDNISFQIYNHQLAQWDVINISNHSDLMENSYLLNTSYYNNADTISVRYYYEGSNDFTLYIDQLNIYTEQNSLQVRTKIQLNSYYINNITLNYYFSSNISQNFAFKIYNWELQKYETVKSNPFILNSKYYNENHEVYLSWNAQNEILNGAFELRLDQCVIIATKSFLSHLKLRNIQYYLYSKIKYQVDDPYSSECDPQRDLIPFIQKLHEYGNLILYQIY